ncbi:fructosamine kinase family protein [Fodinibius salsisoli]|uniref:Fructosamine kinase family protein n=1 Tax=Fodinibius salsisoli TaxID=2820877 RepID=A0ABT3PS64_9BACT|nr:fructosamine kinase family protein [Fodinibius salsisoli]MCW9708703.1 fructosamine kinase family protein [Fodinibius salsisoli]
MIPATVRQSLEQALEADVSSATSVSGGSINKAARITLSDHRQCFLKWNSHADPAMFVKEEKGLQLLRSADTQVVIPEVYAIGTTEDGIGWLAQEYLQEGNAQSNSAEIFGKELAALHQHKAQQFGLDHDNYIGRLPQSNSCHDSWVSFFIRERMEPQLQMAVDAHKLDSHAVAHFENMYEELPDIFPEESPSLLHGDLWGGNYFYDEKDRPCLYDPAVYYGHREIELAFTHLFGGFSSAFYQSYEQHFPLEPGFADRKDIYNLYPLLVHTNLFGGSYARQVQSIVQRF